jgi:asparagine synthase (glutamine-hydrolysing)
LFIARDRLGVKPIYYYYDKNYFVFASELRAILKSGIVKKEIDLQSLSSYFKMQSFYTPSTIIKGIKQLDAGYFVWVDKNGLQQKKYWDIEKTENKVESVDFATAKKNTKSLLIQSVERRMVSDVPVAAFLSGGIDSSAVVGLMAQLTNSPETFNIAFQEKEYDESGFAEIIAKKFNTKHHKILLKPEQFLEELPNAIKAMDIPSGDGINSYVVSKEIVKKGIKVAMSGVGGDELFAGYPTYKYWLNVNKKKWIWKIPKPIRTIVSNTIPGKSSKYERMKKLLNTENLSLNTFYPLVREVVSDDTINNLFKEDIKPFQFDVDVSNFKNKYLSQMSVAELKGFAYNTLLKDTDQYSMASALEVREPFFDSDLIEYVLQLPDAIKYPSYPKKFLVEALENLLPSEIVHRPKKGFTFPWEYWMRNELQSFCKETIKHFSKRDFVNEQFALAMWEKFYVKNFYRWQEIWLIVILESWLQQNYD